jgi:hypothetical protein
MDEAVAKLPLLRGFDDNLFISPDPQTRARWFDEAVEAEANIARIGVDWRFLVGNNPPSNPRDPGDPAYNFSGLDATISDAASRGLKVLITVSNAPAWAEGADRPRRARPGTWKPDPAALGAFGEALARRYSGSYVAGPEGALPRVEYFEAWNEPNQDFFLAPQWQGGSAFAPAHFRRMLNAFYAGVKAASPSAKVVAPATSPFGDPGKGDRMRPLLFMRKLLCLRDRKRLDPTNCPDPARLDIFSHHPISLEHGPRYSAIHPDDATIPDIKNVRRTLRAAERAGTLVPRGSHPLWVTELWWVTGPPYEARISPRKQARYLQGALYELWKQGVKAVIWFQLADDDGFPSGLFYPDGRPKPGLTAFRFPFVLDGSAKGRVRAWGIPPESGRLQIQRKQGGGWRTVKAVSVRDARPFQTKLRSGGSARLRAQIAGQHSLSARG